MVAVWTLFKPKCASCIFEAIWDESNKHPGRNQTWDRFWLDMIRWKWPASGPGRGRVEANPRFLYLDLEDKRGCHIRDVPGVAFVPLIYSEETQRITYKKRPKKSPNPRLCYLSHDSRFYEQLMEHLSMGYFHSSISYNIHSHAPATQWVTTSLWHDRQPVAVQSFVFVVCSLNNVSHLNHFWLFWVPLLDDFWMTFQLFTFNLSPLVKNKKHKLAKIRT